MKTMLVATCLAVAFALSAAPDAMADEMPITVTCSDDKNQSVTFEGSSYPESYNEEGTYNGGTTIYMSEKQFQSYFARHWQPDDFSIIENPADPREGLIDNIPVILRTLGVGQVAGGVVVTISMAPDSLQAVLDAQFGVGKCTSRPDFRLDL